MKNYRLKEENSDHFLLHDTKDGKDFKVAKAHLDLPMMAKLSKVQKFADGGTAEDPTDYESSVATGINQAPMSDEQNQVPTDATQQPVAPQIAENGNQTPTPVQAMPDQGQQNPYDFQKIGQQYGQDIGSALNQEQQANTDIGQAQAQAAQAQAGFAAANAKATQDANGEFQKNTNQIMSENDQIYNQVKNTQIDPNRYWDNKSTGSKIGMLAGMIISGFGAGAGQGNMAMDILNKNIENDIDAQKTNLGKTQSLLNSNMQKYGVLSSAMTATRLNMLSATQGQIEAAAAKSGSQIAMANAQKANAQISQQKAQLTQQLGMTQAGYNMLNQSSQKDGQPMAGGINYKRYLALKMLPPQYGGLSPEDDKAIQDEMGKYQEMTNKVNYVGDNMQAIANEQSLRQRVGNPWKSYKEIEGRGDLTAATAAKDVNGRVNEIIYNAIKNEMPGLLTPELSQEKINNVLGAIKKGYQFHRMQNLGILNQNDTNLMTPAQRQQNIGQYFKKPTAQSSYAGQ